MSMIIYLEGDLATINNFHQIKYKKINFVNNIVLFCFVFSVLRSMLIEWKKNLIMWNILFE